MKSMKYVLALLVFGLGSQAQAISYGWCEAKASYRGAEVYVSGFAEISDSHDAYVAFANGAFAKGFEQYVLALDPDVKYVSCHAAYNMKMALEHRGRIRDVGQGPTVETGWTLSGGSTLTRADLDKSDNAKTSSAPERIDPRAVADAEFERKMAEYNEALAKQQQAVAEYQRRQSEFEQRKAEQAERAKRAAADWKTRAERCLAGDWSLCGATKQ